jgi:hypothetical protein
MSTLTEVTLFNQCVNDPKALGKLSDLNLERITNPQNADHLSVQELM